jgi:hypothetical protein
MVAISAKSTTLNENKGVELVFVRLNFMQHFTIKKKIGIK